MPRRLIRVKYGPREMVAFCPACPINRVKVDGKQTACLHGADKSNSGVLAFVKCDFYEDGSIRLDESGNKSVECNQI